MIITRVPRCALLTGIVLLASCAERPAATPYEPDAALTSNEVDASAIARYSEGAVRFAWTKAWIGPAGGSVRLLDFEIVVPPGAVGKTTQFEIRLPMDQTAAERAMAEFRPHNVTFAKPVTLRLPLRSTTADTSDTVPRVLWWNGAGWVVYPTTLTTDGRIETTTDHFSTYGTEDPSRGITPVGG
jgi:hypothetical protein